MSFLRPGSRKAILLTAPLVVVVGLLTGCATSSTAGNTASTSSSTDVALAKMLPASIKKSGTISFGALFETPPVIAASSTNANVPVGISPDIAAAIAPILGVKATWKNLQWPAQLPGLQSGNVDVLFGQVSVTKEREQSIVDLIPYTKGTFSILVPAGNPKKLTSFADACGTTLGGGVGSTIAAEITGNSKTYCTSKGKPAIKLAAYPNASNAISAIKAGTIDGWVNDTASQKDAASASDGTFTTVLIPDAQTVDYDPGLGGIAVSKSNPGLSKAIAGALKEIVADGTYAKIMKKWKTTDIEVPASEIKVNPLTGTAAGTKASS